MKVALGTVLFAALITQTNYANAQYMSRESGSCKACKEGEEAVRATQVVGHGQYTYGTSPGCGNSVNTADQIRAALGDASRGKLKDFAGGVLDLINSGAQDFISANVHGTVGNLLNGGNNNTASCQNICVIIPESATHTGYKVGGGEGSDATSFPGCTVGQDCPIGWSKFPSTPSVSKGDGTQLVCTVFQNWSGDRNRTAELIAYFRPAAGWAGPRIGD